MRKIVLVSLAVLFALSFTSCNEGNASSKVKKENLESAKKRDSEINKGFAAIKFDKKVHDFGTVKEGDIVEAKFALTNTGKTDLVITKAQPSCGCTVPTWPKEAIKPGETAEVVAKFNTSGKPNKQNKSITLFTNTQKGREMLTIKGNVTPRRGK